jgi:subtilisin family serine protease
MGPAGAPAGPCFLRGNRHKIRMIPAVTFGFVSGWGNPSMGARPNRTQKTTNGILRSRRPLMPRGVVHSLIGPPMKGPAMRSLLMFLCAGLLPVAASVRTPADVALPLPSWAVALEGQPACVRDRLVVRLREQAVPQTRSGAVALADLPALQRFAQGRNLVTSRSVIARSEMDEAARSNGLDRDLVIELAPGSDLEQERAAWSARPEVESVEFDWVVRTQMVANDTYFTQQWALKNTGQAPGNGTADCDIDADEAWDITTGSVDVTIAIVDTGIDLNHPDLQSKIVAGYDFVNNDATADDDNMHGTACGSLAAAHTNNSTGVAGVDWLARLMPIKVLDSNGFGSTTDIVDGVNWARTNGADVISMSLGGGGFSSSFNSAINTAFNAGVFVVAAAGNDNASSISYPALYTNCFAVGALSPCNQRKSPSSCDGETWWGSNYGTGLDVMAPGVKLRSATINSYINDMNGTSGATPHVAGIAGLLKAADPGATAAEIRDILRASAVDMGTAGWDTQTGYGRVNAAAALAMLAPPDPCDTDSAAPVIVHSPLGDTTDTSSPYAVVATVTDECSIYSVVLRRQINGGTWVESAMAHQGGGVYNGSIPAQPAGTQVNYQVVATDNSANFNAGQFDGAFWVLDPCATDFSPPAISITAAPQDTYNTAGPYVVLLDISDPCGLLQVAGQYQVDGGASQNLVPVPLTATVYSLSIPGQAPGSSLSWSAIAIDASPYFNLAQVAGQFDVLDPCALDNTDPSLSVVTPFVDTQDTAGPYLATVSASDPCGLGSVVGSFQANGGSAQALAVTDLGGGQFGLSIPGQAAGSVIDWSVTALDASPAQNDATVTGQFQIIDPCATDTEAPQLALLTPFADTPDTAGPYSGTLSAADPCGLTTVGGSYQVDGGPAQVLGVTALGGDQYGLSIPGQPAGSVITWSVVAVDGSPALNPSSTGGSFTIVIVDPCLTDATGPGLVADSPFADTDDTAGPYAGGVSTTDPCGISSLAGQYQVDGGPAQPIGVTDLGSGVYTLAIPGQPAGSQISWTVTSTDDSPAQNASQLGGTFQVLFPPAAPAVTVLHLGNGVVRLQWDSVPEASLYRVYIAGADGVYGLHQQTALTQLDYPGVPGELKRFRVTAER